MVIYSNFENVNSGDESMPGYALTDQRVAFGSASILLYVVRVLVSIGCVSNNFVSNKFIFDGFVIIDPCNQNFMIYDVLYVS